MAISSVAAARTSPQPSPLPTHWDVALDANQVTFTDLDRRAAKADVAFEIPLSKLGLTKKEAQALLQQTASSAYLSPGQGEPEAKLEICPTSGHSAFEPGITDALVRATDRFAK